MRCPLILPLICSYMWDLSSKTHIWCISDFVLKIGCYNSLPQPQNYRASPQAKWLGQFAIVHLRITYIYILEKYIYTSVFDKLVYWKHIELLITMLEWLYDTSGNTGSNPFHDTKPLKPRTSSSRRRWPTMWSVSCLWYGY